MNSTLRFFSILFALHVALLAARANDVSLVQPNIPETSWEQRPGGVALAVVLTTHTENGVSTGSLRVYIKNTADAEVRFYRGRGNDGIHIFYNDGGSYVPLRDYSGDTGPHLSNRLPPVIKPGATLCVTIDLSSNEVALLTSHSVKCDLVIYDPTTLQKHTLETTPKVLSSGP